MWVITAFNNETVADIYQHIGDNSKSPFVIFEAKHVRWNKEEAYGDKNKNTEK
jgi:hypothetical protein